jgi:hypothetical protein
MPPPPPEYDEMAERLTRLELKHAQKKCASSAVENVTNDVLCSGTIAFPASSLLRVQKRITS